MGLGKIFGKVEILTASPVQWENPDLVKLRLCLES